MHPPKHSLATSYHQPPNAGNARKKCASPGLSRRRAMTGLAGGLAGGIAAALGSASSPARADGLFGLPPLQDGDLIFHSSRSFQSAAIMQATGSPITHMGIIDKTRLGPRVIEAHAVVRDLALSHWILHGRGAAFIIRRYPGLRSDQARAIVKDAHALEGRPYDLMFDMDNQRPYCSEFAYVLFARQGIRLGRIQKLGELNLRQPEVQKLLKRRARRHPKCAGVADATACERLLLNQPIITPRSILEDPQLVTVARFGF